VLHRARHYTTLYGYFLRQSLKRMLEYRVNFIIGVLSMITFQAAVLLTVWIVMRQVPDLQGWTLDEVLLIYGLVTLAKALNQMFADNLWHLGSSYIQSGHFDRFLVRPVPPLFHLLADRFAQEGIGNLLLGLFLTGHSLWILGVILTPIHILVLLIGVICGAFIFFALNLLMATAAFWVYDSTPVIRAVYEMHLLAHYPLTMYPRALELILTWIIPYAFASYYPSAYVLGREVGQLVWVAPLVTLVIVVIAHRVWRFGLRHYGSTGS
jgi:ABC-2 type transport system permease protein